MFSDAHAQGVLLQLLGARLGKDIKPLHVLHFHAPCTQGPYVNIGLKADSLLSAPPESVAAVRGVTSEGYVMDMWTSETVLLRGGDINRMP